MFRKVTFFSLTLVAFLLAGQSAFAQEEGTTGEKPHEEILVPQDSSIIYESGEVETLVQPTSTPFNIPVKDSHKRNTTSPLESSVDRPTSEGDIKPKESKQDFSFNIIYYLIYKFKQVDN